MTDFDALAHRKRMTKSFHALPQKAGRAFEALRSYLEGRPNLVVDRHRPARRRIHKIGGKARSDRVAAVSRPKVDTHYFALALIQLAKEDDGTLMKNVQRLQARTDKERH